MENSFKSERDNKGRENSDGYKRDDRSEVREGKARLCKEPGELEEGKKVLKISIEESNKLRAKIRLQPLNISNIVDEEDDSESPGELIPGDKDKTRPLVPQHRGEMDRQEQLVEKLGLNMEQSRVEGIVEKEKQQDEFYSNELKGMRVEYSSEAFGESPAVLTLQ